MAKTVKLGEVAAMIRVKKQANARAAHTLKEGLRR